MTDGFGAITWWGFSPALDLQDEGIHRCHCKKKKNVFCDSIYILIFCLMMRVTQYR